ALTTVIDHAGNLASPARTTTSLMTFEGTPVPTQAVASDPYARVPQQGQHFATRGSALLQPRASRLSPSSSWQQLGHQMPQMAGTGSFPITNWTPADQVRSAGMGQHRMERIAWKETPTRRMSGAFTSPPLSARLPREGGTTTPASHPGTIPAPSQ
ncbi:unnamed protein product, partial [Effrenium voratum]